MTIRTEALEFITFCDGVQEAGLEEYARRGRNIARSVLELYDMVGQERAVRQVLQARCEAQQNLLGRRADQAMLLLEAAGWDGIDFPERNGGRHA